MSAPDIQLDFCNAGAVERLAAIEQRLKELGVTTDLLLSGVVDVRINTAKMSAKIMASYSDVERQIIYLNRTHRGSSISEIAQRLNTTADNVLRVMQKFNASLKSELTGIFRLKAMTLDKLLLDGLDDAILGGIPAPESDGEPVEE